MERERVGLVASVVGAIGACFIYPLIWLFGRTHRRADIGWLVGPIGGDVIGDAPYREVAAAEGLTVERAARDGGLVPDFDALARRRLRSRAQSHPLVREFYEHTAEFAMDVWSQTYFPASLALCAAGHDDQPPGQPAQLPAVAARHRARHGQRDHLAARARRQRALHGLVPHARASSARPLHRVLHDRARAAGARRRASRSCSRCRAATRRSCCARRSAPAARSMLDSSGGRFGDAGFYRVQARDAGSRARVAHPHAQGALPRLRRRARRPALRPRRCRFLGLPVLRLHYKIGREHRV